VALVVTGADTGLEHVALPDAEALEASRLAEGDALRVAELLALLVTVALIDAERDSVALSDGEPDADADGEAVMEADGGTGNVHVTRYT
jgi:hypothetical protein